MTRVQIFKVKNVDLGSLYKRLKRSIEDDNFKVTSDVVTENVYHLRAEKTGLKNIIIGSVRDIELVIAGDPSSFAVVFNVGAWGQNLSITGSAGYVVATLVEGPALAWGGIAAAGSYVKAVAYERDFWQTILNEVDFQVKSDKKKDAKAEGEGVR
ncbi:MAG: hypothetical protein ABIJ47_12550 [Candidatus Bathyarchaeota archaeon]